MNNYFLDSPVPTNRFIWMAAYSDGTFSSEYSYDNQKENSFYLIDKQKLIRFGVVGYGMNLYYEVFGGVFKIAGQMIEVFIKDKNTNNEYYLTGKQLMYNDIIQYKQAESDFDSKGRNGLLQNTTISQYNFGYKQNIQYDDVNFNFKAICGIPFGKPVYLNFRLVSDKHIDGVFCVKQNGLTVHQYDVEIEKNFAYELNWQVSI